MNHEVHTAPTVQPDDIEAVIAGTLMLMTHFSLRRCRCISTKIGENLSLLEGCQYLSPTFRMLCQRLRQEWIDINDESQKALLEMIELQREHASLH